MKNKKLIVLAALTLVAIIIMVVLWIITIVGALDITDGCIYRYNFDKDKTVSSASSVMSSVTLKAAANYSGKVSEGSDSIELDPNDYGKWLNTNLRVKGGQKVNLVVKGKVSLCKAYIPDYNLQEGDAIDTDRLQIEIPRVENKSKNPINLILDAKTAEWRNIAEVYQNDHVVVSILRDKKTTVGDSFVYNDFTKSNIYANCNEGKSEYSPICGRYSLLNGAEYVDTCEYDAHCTSVTKCRHNTALQTLQNVGIGAASLPGYIAGLRVDNSNRVLTDGDNSCLESDKYKEYSSCYKNIMEIGPKNYRNDGKYTSPWVDSISKLGLNTMSIDPDCNKNHKYINGAWQNEQYFWLSADDATGLLSRYNSNPNPRNKSALGGEGSFDCSKIDLDNSDANNDVNYRVIKDEIFADTGVSYLQYRLYNNASDVTSNTGGYVLNIKQTKCRRENGNSFNDSYEGRGRIQYIISDYSKNPNEDSMDSENLTLDINGSGSIVAASNENGNVWLRINNHPDDYKNSFGQYRVEFLTSIDQGGFYHDVLDPFFQGFKGKIQGASEQMFKNMTCYQGISGDGGCTNFFNYIKGLLTLYIMIYGMMFLLGMVHISQTDLVIRVTKIGLVAGLMNGSTFEFFNNYVFDFVTGFTDDIISNMAGYSLFSGSTSVSNPFMFLDEVMTKIFLSPSFIAQILALLSMGISGVIYFILIVVCLGVLIIVLLRSIAVYLMAFMSITLLIGIAPLFLTFILFEKTFYLFDNWVKFMFRYMLEPVMLLAGIIILTQLFTIYLDFVIGYSVCWKCAIPIKIPFAEALTGFSHAFIGEEIFCLNWFAPWGFDHRSSQMGINMQNMIVLLMIVYCMWGYIDFSESIVGKIAGSAGGPSATAMGKDMSSAIEQKALSAVGLDKGSREAIKKSAKSRLKSMGKSDKGTPIDKGNRHDVKSESGKGGKGSGPEDNSSSEDSDTGSSTNVADNGGSSSAGSSSRSSSESLLSSLGANSRSWKPGGKPTKANSDGVGREDSNRDSNTRNGNQTNKVTGSRNDVRSNQTGKSSAMGGETSSSENSNESSTAGKADQSLKPSISKQAPKVNRPSLESSAKKLGNNIDSSGSNDGDSD